MFSFDYVLMQSLFAFVALFIISKLLGKKQVAQLEFTDYVIGISIGSIAAEMATEDKTPYFHFLVAMAVFALLDLSITLVSRKAMFLKKIFKGRPLVIIEQGKINYQNLKKSKLDINELLAQCRVAGYFDISQIYYCIFETSGDFSILPKSDNTNTTKQDLNIKEPEKELIVNLVVDGVIINGELKKINKDKKWLYKKLKLTNNKDTKNILLATYNKTTKEVVTHNEKM